MLGEVYKTVVDFFEPIVTLGEGKKDEPLKPHQQVQQALLITPKKPQTFCHSPYSFEQQQHPQNDIPESKPAEIHSEETPNTTNRNENTNKVPSEKPASKKNKQKGRRSQGNNPPPVCLDYLKGMCNQRRWKCKYAHPPLPVSNAIKEESTEVVCDVWILTGFCKFGDGCRNYHPPLEDTLTGAPIAPPLTAKYHQQSQKKTKKRRPRNNVNSQATKVPSEVAEVVDDKSDSEDEATPSTPLTPPTSSANTVMKKVQGILNKITIQKFEPLFYQLFELLSSNEGITVQQIIPVLFSKAIAEPHLSGVYGQLCSRIYFWSNPQQQTALCSQLVHLVRTLLEAEDLTSGMAEEQLARMQVRRLGNMQFFGELFLQGLVNEYQVTDVIYYLLEKSGPNNDFEKAAVAIELTCKLLTCIGQQLDVNSPHTMDFYLQHLYELSINHSNRIKILVHNAIELRSRSWIGRHDEHRRALSYNDYYHE